MRHIARIACAVVLCLTVLPQDSHARRYYPRGYGQYGWGGWGMGGGGGGTDPAAGYMAGLGAFARGQGVYEVEDAKAQSINFETMKKWNQELRARQQELQAAKEKAAAEQAALRDARVERMDLENGTTLNKMLLDILGFDPTAIKSSQAQAPIGAAAVREIPFEWNTEAITVCIDQLTARGALPDILTQDTFAAERSALGEAVDAALKEDAKGDVSAPTMKRLTTAIANFRAKFVKTVPRNSPDYDDGDDYFGTLASLSRMLHDPSMKKALGELENVREISIGDLIGFMQTYNLRFGPATTRPQVEIYQALISRIESVKNSVAATPPPPPPGGADGKGLQAAARNAFKDIGWPQLNAHAGQP